MSEINVEINQPNVTANVTSPNVVANVETANVEANIQTAEIVANVTSPNIQVNITGGGLPHLIKDEGTPLSQRNGLNFVGAGVTVTDDSANNQTVVTIAGGGGGAVDWGDIGGTLSDQTDLQTVLDGKADTSHTHPLSEITQSSATTGQVPKWNGSAWAPDDESGGGASIIDITYADMETALAGSTLTKGQFYRITDANGTDLGFVCQAVRDNEITVNGTGGYLNADFQGVGDYGATPETFGTQKGIWRTGFEAVAITYANLDPAFILYSGASGLFSGGETITGDDNGSTADVVSDDGSGTLIVTNVSGDWTTETTFQGGTSGETATLDTFDAGGGTFAVGDTITGGTTGATAVIVTDDGIGSMTAAMTSFGVSFDGSDVLDNGNGVTADMDGAAGSREIVLGDLVIWNLLHYQLTDDTLLDGTDPETNTAAYTLLDKATYPWLYKATYPETYVTAWDISEFDFPNNWIQYRADDNGNSVRSSFDSSNDVFRFQWGNDNKKKVVVSNSNIDIRNTIGTVENVLLLQGAAMYDINISTDYQIKNCIVQNAGQIDTITNSTINRALVQNTARIGDLENCVVEFCTMDQNSRIRNSKNAVFLYCTLFPNAQIYDVVGASNTPVVLSNNILENGASLTGIAAGANCQISRNKIGQGATLGGGTTLAADSEMNDNVLDNGASITAVSVDGQFNVMRVGPSSIISDISLSGTREVVNVTLGPYITWSNKTIEADVAYLNMDIENTSTETVSAELKVKTSRVGFSNFQAEIDATGLAALDLLAENQHVGLFTLTSSNATETISADSLSNFQTALPFRLIPAAGLELTLTCTAAASATTGSIVGSAGTIVLNGDNGDFVELEADSTGTFVRVKNLQVYA